MLIEILDIVYTNLHVSVGVLKKAPPHQNYFDSVKFRSIHGRETVL